MCVCGGEQPKKPTKTNQKPALTNNYLMQQNKMLFASLCIFIG